MTWDYDADRHKNERRLATQLRDRLAPFLGPADIEDAIGAVFPAIRDFAGRYAMIEERRRVREARAKR